MSEERRDVRGRDLQRELVLGGPALGSGGAPGGSWELRALYEAVEAGEPRYLYFYVEYRNHSGGRAGGGGCGGLDLANEQRPVVISMTGRAPGGSFCYVGQAIDRITHVELILTGSAMIQATLLRGDLPVQLWVAFTDGADVPATIRVFDGTDELAAVSIAQDLPRGNECWGPIDE